jgi:hypothetical protein
MAMADVHEYVSDDCDIEENRLRVYQGENGDWYVQICKPGERIGVAVRVTTSGVRHPGVALAVKRLHDVMPRAGREEPECTGLTASWCPIHGECNCLKYEDGERDEYENTSCPLHGPSSTHPIEEVARG